MPNDGEKPHEPMRPKILNCVFRRSHIFDGVTIAKETAAFQLCDVQDPMLKEMIEKEEDLRETCDVSELALIFWLGHSLYRNAMGGIVHMLWKKSKPFYATNSSHCFKDMSLPRKSARPCSNKVVVRRKLRRHVSLRG